MSVIWSRRTSVRSIDITGVMPEPAVTNSTAGGAGSGSTKLPCGRASRTIVPGLTPSTRCVDRKPSGIAFTVIVTVRAPRCDRLGLPGSALVRAVTGLGVNEYERGPQRVGQSKIVIGQ